jgi:hypothetical protein
MVQEEETGLITQDRNTNMTFFVDTWMVYLSLECHLPRFRYMACKHVMVTHGGRFEGIVFRQ